MELISGIITTHNRDADIVERALKSILNQTHTNIEVIVVDDSSPDFADRDNVKQIVESYSDRNVRYIRHSECKGACAARNTGLADAKGEIIGFLDDDDEWMPTKVEKMLPLFDDKEVAIVYSDWLLYCDDDGTVTNQNTQKHSGSVFDKLIMGVNFIGSTSFPLLRKKCVKEVGGFDVLMQSAQDLDLWLRLSQKYAVGYIDEALNNYHMHNGERISTNYNRRINGNKRLIEKNIEYLKTHKSAYYVRNYILFFCYLNAIKYKESFLVCMKCWSIIPGNVHNNLIMLVALIKKIFIGKK